MTKLPPELEARARDFANLASLDMDDAAKAGAVGLALDFARACYVAGAEAMKLKISSDLWGGEITDADVNEILATALPAVPE